MRSIACAILILMLAACEPSPEIPPTNNSNEVKVSEVKDSVRLDVPIDYYTLDNGLKIVISPDDTAPIATIGVYYNIGFRIEPRNRTGFAHLFEHMMFQGSENLGKLEFIRLIQTNGGVLNGSTRFDFTNYFQVVPAHQVETVLWAEADRMKGLAITQENLENQQEVVKNEVKVNVLNRPYGGFPWLDMPQYAFKNWNNAHNFYGDLDDLDAATLEDVQTFFDQYYTPSNAVVVVVGDINIDAVKSMIEEYFSGIPSTPAAQKPDLSEPAQLREQRFNRYDKLAPKPGFAFAYKMPEVGTPEYYAMGVIDQLVVQGPDSLLFQELVKDKEFTGNINAGINHSLGNMFNYNGPMLWMTSFTHNADISEAAIVQSIDTVIAKLQEVKVSQDDVDRALVKLRSSLYDNIDNFYGFGKVDLLASFALFEDAPQKINTLEEQFLKVTPELIQQTAKTYLASTQRTVLTLTPGEDPGSSTTTETTGE